MYDGTAYHGWQVQKTERHRRADAGEGSVDGLRRAGPRRRAAAGRTRASTPSTMWPISTPSSRIPVDRLPFAVNTHIPEDIAVLEAYEVADDFNAIGSCIRKEYTYRIYNSRVQEPVLCQPGIASTRNGLTRT